MEDEQERLEAGLRRTPPATVPPELMERLRTALASRPAQPPASRPAIGWRTWLTGWRGWAATATAAALVILLWLGFRSPAGPARVKSSVSPATAPAAVQVDHSLVATFDEVAQMPDGEPVRFRCREWQDDVVIHDHAHGVMISSSTPRLEVIPLRFETY